jgi:hypothetical protein
MPAGCAFSVLLQTILLHTRKDTALKRQFTRLTMLLGVVGLLAALSIFAFGAVASAEWVDTGADTPTSEVQYSHRLIVELESAPLTVKYPELPGARSADGKLNARSAAAQDYVQQIQAEQATLMANVQSVLPQARVSTYLNEQGMQVAQQYQVVLNAVVVDAGLTIGEGEIEALRRLPGVKAVHRDYARYPQLYTSTHLINAPAVWSMLGGQADAGRGIKLASMDGGVHKDAPI